MVAVFRIVLLEFRDNDVECFYSYLVLSARSTTLGIDGYVLTVVFAWGCSTLSGVYQEDEDTKTARADMNTVATPLTFFICARHFQIRWVYRHQDPFKFILSTHGPWLHHTYPVSKGVQEPVAVKKPLFTGSYS